MIWFLLVLGVLMIVLGVWGGPLRRKRAEKSSRVPKDATVQEAWDILTSPVQYDEELIKIPEHRPWFIPGTDRRFIQGVLVGLGSGLLVAALAVTFLDGPVVPPPTNPPGQTAANDPTTSNPAPAAPGTANSEPTTPTTPTDNDPTAPETPAETPAEPGEGDAEPTGEPDEVTFTIEPGSSSQDIAAAVKGVGLVATEKEFLDRVAELGVETSLQAGTFTIPTDATIDEVVAQLTQ